MKYKLITGANDHYILTLIEFIMHYISNGFDLKNLIVYNLGLNHENLIKLNDANSNGLITIKHFDYSLYPEHVDLNKYYGLNCSYAFKPIIIYNEANIFHNYNIIWLDCACRINTTIFDHMVQSINVFGFYCPVGNYEKSIETIELNHPQTVQLLGITKYEHFNLLQTRLACIIGLNYNSFNGKNIMDDWYKYSLQREVIFPEKSSRNNHRQDQTVLSVIMYLFEKKYNIVFEKSNFDISCWNKLDKPAAVSVDYSLYALIDKNNVGNKNYVYAKTVDEAITIYHERKQISREMLLTNYKGIVVVIV